MYWASWAGEPWNWEELDSDPRPSERDGQGVEALAVNRAGELLAVLGVRPVEVQLGALGHLAGELLGSRLATADTMQVDALAPARSGLRAGVGRELSALGAPDVLGHGDLLWP